MARPQQCVSFLQNLAALFNAAAYPCIELTFKVNPVTDFV